MRGAFVSTLLQLAQRDERVVLLTGDLGFSVLEPFREHFPDRFVNVGVAEQNMLGLATGLAEAGFLPFVYSIATFAVLRPYEFIRNGPVAHRLPVRVVGIGAGLDYASNGLSHHALEDLALTRAQPGLTVVCPADAPQAAAALLATWDRPGPIYYRLGKDDAPPLAGLDGRFSLGRLETIGDGGDLLIVCIGGIAEEAQRAVELLARSDIQATLAIVSSLNPAPVADLRQLLARFPLAMSVEVHQASGGLGSLVAEVIADHGLATRLLRRALDEPPDSRSGSRAYLYQKYGLSGRQLARAASQLLHKRNGKSVDDLHKGALWQEVR